MELGRRISRGVKSVVVILAVVVLRTAMSRPTLRLLGSPRYFPRIV
jgi:hypothetical protein